MPPDQLGQPWDGKGLPPVARERIARANSSGVATSLLSVAGAASLEGCGFRPVGEVMGSLVQHLGWQGSGCGAYYGTGYTSPTVTSGSGNRWAGLGPYVRAQYHGWDTAMTRMLAEAAALGADGVVGVSLREHRIDDGGNREFQVLGTAVRSRGRTHAQRPFATELGGADVAKLLHAGWVPTGIAYGLAAAIRHDDGQVWRQATSWSNTEVAGYTELVTHVRHDARHQFTERAARIGGDAALVSSTSLHVWEYEPSDNHRDHIAQARFLGSTVARFHQGRTAPTTSLSILPLRGTTTKEITR